MLKYLLLVTIFFALSYSNDTSENTSAPTVDDTTINDIDSTDIGTTKTDIMVVEIEPSMYVDGRHLYAPDGEELF